MEYTFVWAVNGKSNWNNNEVKYSIASVKKFHPDADIIIIGEKPDFYDGKFIQHKDIDASPYINKWKKIIRLCKTEEIPDQFVVMDDDFFLLAPLERKHYGIKETYHQKVNTTPGITHWTSALKNTKRYIDEDTRNYCVHCPLWIDKKSFLEMVDKYDWDTPPGLVMRQLYLSYTNGSIFEIEELERDVKTRNLKDIDNFQYFFSTSDDLVSYGFHQKLIHMYGNV